MSVAPIMTAGLGDLLPVVIIITVVIARIIKATKQQGPAGQSPSRPSGSEPVAPGEELRDFLKTLGAPTPPRPTPPPPPVQVVQAERPVMRRTAPAPAVAVRHTGKPLRRARKFARPHAQGRLRTALQGMAHAYQGGTSAHDAIAPPPTPAKPAPFWNQPAPPPRPIVVEACELTPAREELNKHLEDRHSLRGAWLLREVLGPPVALQKQQ
jgi:hypothetical protein